MLSRHKSRVHVPVSITGGFLSDLNEEQFIAELARLRGVPVHLFNSQPRLNGHPISLLKLYNAVALRGGSKKVTSQSLWDEVAGAISLQADCVNIGQAAKNVFQNYLGSYERVQRSVDGQPGGDILEVDLVNDPSLSLQVVENHLRHRWNLSTDLIESVEYRALLLALESGLPNELDYAINTVLLMSSQQNGFELARCPQILPLMLSTVGVHSLGPCSYYLLKNGWRSHCNRNFLKFWQSVIPSTYGRQFLNSDVFSYKHLPKPLDETPLNVTTCLTFRDTMTYHDVEGFRVQLVAMVIRNLAVTPSANALILSQEPDVLRFACLCIYSSHTALRHLGLDILAYLHFPVVGPLGDVLVNLIPVLLASQDRVDVTRGLTILRHLCESPIQSHQGLPGSPHTYLVETSSRNLDFLTQSLLLPSQRGGVIGLVIQLVCIRDLHILVLALDAVFALSTQGPALCDALVLSGETEGEVSEDGGLNNSLHHLIATLVAFLSFEAQSFGSDGLIRIRIMQVPGNTSMTVANATTTNTLPSSVTAPRRILEKPIAIAMSPPTQPLQQQQPVKRDIQSAALASNLMLSPAPQPHAGCYAVPVPVTAAGPISTKPPLHPGRLTAAAMMAIPTQETAVAPATSMTKTAVSVAAPKNTTDAMDSQMQVQPSAAMILTPVAPRPSVVPVVVAAPKPMFVTAASPSSPLVSNGKQVQQTVSSTERKINAAPLRQSLQSPPSSSTTTATTSSTAASPSSSLINALPKPYPNAPADKREFATFWLNKNYEVHPQSSFPRVLIYAEYQKAHQVQFGTSLGAALSAGDFHAMIKTVFPPVDQVKVLVPNGNVEIHYNKLKHVDAPEPVEQTLGVQHMLGTCLANQNPDSKGLAFRASTVGPPLTSPAVGTAKISRKRSAVNLIDTPSGISTPEVVPVGAKQVRLVEDTVKANGGSSGVLPTPPATASTLLNGAAPTTPQPIKLLTTNPATFVDGFIPVSTNGPIEIAASGIQLQPPVIAASAIAFPIMDSKRMLNGFATTPSAGVVSTAGTVGATPTLIDASQGVIQFRTLLPSAPNTVSSPANRVTTPCRPSLVMQSTAPGALAGGNTSGSGAAEIAAPPTLTCLGTFMAATSTVSAGVTGGTPQQVFLYSLAPNAQLSISPSPATILSTNPTSQQTLIATPQPSQQPARIASATPVTSAILVCLWSECRRSFPSCDRLFAHVYSTHFVLLKGQRDVTCLWSNCKESSIKRGSLSLLEHLREQHCSVPSTSDEETTLTLLTTAKPSVAECDFRRTLQSDFPPSTADSTREGPITKHIRLTAALILQNLVSYSSVARRQLSGYESLLCYLAFSGGEASNVLVKCLAVLATELSTSNVTGNSSESLR